MFIASVLKQSTRARLVALTLLICALSVGTLAGYTADLLQRDAERQASLLQATAAALLARQINAQVELRLQTLDGLARQLAAEPPGEPGRLRHHVQQQTTLAHLFNAGLLEIDADGMVTDSVTPAPAVRQVTLTPTDQTFLDQLGAATVARPGLGWERPGQVVSLVVPLPAPGTAQPRRWIIGQVEMQALGLMLHLGRGLGVDAAEGLQVLSERFKAEVASNATHRITATGAASDPRPDLATLLAAGLGTHTLHSGDQGAVLLSMVAIPVANWRLVAHVPLHRVLEPVVLAQQRLWLVAASLALLCTALIGGVLWRQFRPVVSAAQALADPVDLHTLPEALPACGPNEVGQLMAGIQRLLQQLRTRQQELDAQTDELTQINQQLQAILQHVPQLVWLKDLQGRYITCNTQFEAFFDLPIATVMGHTDDDFFLPEQARLHREDDVRAMQSRSMNTVQRWCVSAQSTHPVLLEISKVALRDSNGHSQAVLGIAQDVTERWRLTQFEQLRSQVLELLVLNTALPVLLQTLADGLHNMQSEWSCAFMLVQDSTEGGKHLNVVASAGLDSGWIEHMRGVRVEQGVCSCATAAATGKRVLISDIAHSDASPQYREQAHRSGLVASWSQPLLDQQSQVIGVLSIYQRVAAAPEASDLTLLTHLANLAEIALQRARADERTRASASSFRALSENTPEAVLVHRHGVILYANPAAVRLFGAASVLELKHKTAQQLIAPECWPKHQARIQAIESGQAVEACIESRFVRLDGQFIDVEVQGTPVLFDGAAAVHVSVRDVTQRNETRRQLQLAASVFEHALEGIMITDAQANIVDVNASFSRITGYGRDEVLGRNPKLLQSGRHDAAFYRQLWNALLQDGRWSGEVCNRRKDGQLYTQMLHISAVRGAQGELQQCVGLLSDITARKSQEERLNQLAHFDALTGLPNRTLHADRLRQAMANVMRRHRKLGVAFVDLDGFKAVNDSFGHDAGDHVLVTLAKRMRQALREVDTLSRIGGDEFAAIIVDLEYQSDCDPLLQRLLAAANEPMRYKGHLLQVSASVGVTFYPQAQGISADQLLQQADLAMYRAKHQGKNQVQVSGFSDL